MKKRVLSFLLMLAMLVSVVPTMAFATAASEQVEEETPRSESFTPLSDYYALYKTEGLLAFFDAFNPDNGTLKLDEGKWYAKVYDAEKKTFVVSETLYATIVGGVYDAEKNPTGWQKGASGFGFADPAHLAPGNKVDFTSFAENLLSYKNGEDSYKRYDNWTVDSHILVNLRENPTLYYTHTVDSEEHKMTVNTENVDAPYKTEYSITATLWGTTKQITAAIVGTENAEVTLLAKLNGVNADETAKEEVVKTLKVKLNAEGKGTAKIDFSARYTDIKLLVPAGVTVESMSHPVYTKDNACNIGDAFTFGPISGQHWANTLAEDYSGGGAGTIRWSVINSPAAYGGHLIIGNQAVESNFQNFDSFVTVNGVAANLVATKVKNAENQVTYGISHAGVSIVSKATTEEAYADRALHIMKDEQGLVYAVRVYAKDGTEPAISEADLARNAAADILLRLNVDLAVYNTMNDEMKENFLTTVIHNLPKGITKEECENTIKGMVQAEKDKLTAKDMTDYEKLYIGADGSTTANGGKLVALFGALGGTSVNLLEGTWVNKVGDINATFGNPNQWQKREDGGVGVTYFYGVQKADGTVETKATTNNVAVSGALGNLNTRLNFGLDLLPKDDFTIEYVAKYNPIYIADEKGEIAKDEKGNLLEYFNWKGNGISSAQYTGAIDYIGFISSWVVTRDGTYSNHQPNRGDVVWMLSDKTPSWGVNTDWVGGAPFTAGLKAPALRDYGSVHTYVYMRDETTTMDGDNKVVEATYSILRDSVAYASQKLSTANVDPGTYYYDKDDTGNFYLSSSLPTDFYQVRIYDGVLTKEEMQYNTFIDMAAYANADLSQYNSLDDATKQIIVSSMVEQGFASDAVVFEGTLQSLLALYGNPVKAEDSFYITDGLRVLTAAYNGFNTGYLVAGDGKNVSWFNAVNVGEAVTLKNAGWHLKANGGFYMIKDYAEISKDRSFGIFLDGATMLPEGDYTVEMVINPTGIVEYLEDGSYTRYIDSKTTYGIHYEHGFSLGALRCLIFPSKSDGGGQRSGLEKRWCYDKGNECWNNTSTRNHIMTERSWGETSINDIISYRITLDIDDILGDAKYQIYTNDEIDCTKIIAAKEVISNADANNMFQLMVGMPAGTFTVRVYDRVLTEAEKLQNHAADIIYYYDLDTTLLENVLSFFEGDTTKVFRGLASLNFSMTKEMAQETFDKQLSALWLSYNDVGVRSDYTNGVRYYFTFDEDTATIMINGGYQLEIGAIANVGQNSLPTLDGRNYDYKILAYDSIGGKNNGFFVDEDTFAVTVKASSSNKYALLENISVRGYVRLISAEGEEMVFYADVEEKTFDTDSIFAIYEYMQGTKALEENLDLLNYISTVTTDCYIRDYIYLKPDAAEGGNGTKDAPFNNFKDAIQACKDQLKTINIPTYLYLQADDGVYEVTELLMIDGEDVPYKYSRFIITSKSGNSTLTSNKLLDNNAFVEAADNIWMYQFEKDDDGNYPVFRYLYVNGTIADMAHNGARSINAHDELRYQSKFYRFEDGPHMVAYNMWKAGTLTVDEIYYPAEKLALRTRFAYYRDYYLAYDEIMAYENGVLTPDTPTKVEDPSYLYAKLFEDFKYKRVATVELNTFYYSASGCDGNADLALEMLPFMKTSYQDAPATYVNFLADLVEQAITAIKAKKDISIVIGENMPQVPGKPTASQVDSDDNPFQFTIEPSSEMYALVMSMYAAGTLTHESVPSSRDLETATGAQFLYFRDAFLALGELNALINEKIPLTMESKPLAKNGSEQFYALFTQYLYEALAVEELSALASSLKTTIKDGSLAYDLAAFAVLETKLEGANDAYKAVFNRIRDEKLLSATSLSDLSAFNPSIEEVDAPYKGKIPLIDPRTENKVYFNKELVGDQSVAITQGRARLAATSASILSDAKAAYDALYAEYVAVQTKYLELLCGDDTGAAKAYKDTVNKALNDTKAAYTAYQNAMVTAAQYLDDEYDERFVLEGSGLEFQMVNEWNFNIIHMAGIDYDDKIVVDGEEHVALYLNEKEYKTYSLHSEAHFGNRMTAMQFSYAYLDRNNEYYYDAVEGKLYYYNEDGIDGLTIEYPRMNNMFYLTNTQRLTISNLAFTGLDDTVLTSNGFTGGQAGSENHLDCVGMYNVMPTRAPIYGRQIYDLTIEGCNFHDLGCEGITLRDRVENTTISDNSFTNIGAAGIRIGGENASNAKISATEGAVNVYVTNNYLDNIAEYLYLCPAIVLQYCMDVVLTYNTILNCSYSGFSIGWSWSAAGFMYGESVRLMHVEIAYNYIASFMQEMGDGGAIYTLGGNASKDEHRLFNWCHDNYMFCTNTTGDGEKHFFSAMYHDGSSTNWETYNNVVVAHSKGAAIEGGVYKGTETENISDRDFEEIDTELSKDEYLRRQRNRRESIYYYYEQTVAGADAYNITLRNNYLINCRSSNKTGTKQGSQHYEAFRGRARSEYFIYVENMHYIKDPGNIPSGAEDIVYEAGCDWYKGDPLDFAENNY